MTVYTDEVNIYNTDAIAKGIEDAENAYKTVVEVDTNGIRLHPAEQSGSGIVDYTQIDTTGVRLFKNDGSGGSKQVAKFGDTVTIGKPYVSGATDNESHMELDYHSMQLIDKLNNVYFHVSHLPNQNNQIIATFNGDGEETLFKLPAEATNTSYSVKVDDVEVTSTWVTKYTTDISFSSPPEETEVITVTFTPKNANACKALTFGNRNSSYPIGALSSTYGYGLTASGECSSSEGYQSMAMGNYSHAEGYQTQAKGKNSHSEGNISFAIGLESHAEGHNTIANGDYSHSEGYNTWAYGKASKSSGVMTKARGDAQVVIGSFNVEDTATTTTHPSGNADYKKYAFIIGNGTSNSERSNAFAVDWQGTVIVNNEPVRNAWCYTSSVSDVTMTYQNTSASPHVYTLPITAIDQVKPSGAFVFSYNSTHPGIKAKVAGWYAVSVEVSSSNSANGDLIGVGVRRIRNGAETNVAGPEYERCAGSYARICLLPTPVYLQVDDQLYITVQNNSTGGKTINTCRLMIRGLLG